MAERIADLGYSKDLGRIEAVVPHGTRVSELAKIVDILFSKDIAAHLPRGCQACTSGDHLIIRERLENVLRVDLNKKTIIGH